MEQPVADIEQQLGGLPVAEKPPDKYEYVFIERRRTVNALFTFAITSSHEECKRRSEAINALVALSSLQGAERAYSGKAKDTDIEVY